MSAALAAAQADRFAHVRDRELLDLIEALDATTDVIAFIAISGEKLSERQKEWIGATLDKAVDVLSELREARS